VSDDDAIFEPLYRDLRRFAAVVGPLEVEPEDLVQEALVRALSRGPLSELQDPGAYLRAAIVRLSSNHRRRLGRARKAVGRVTPVVSQDQAYPSDLAELAALRPEGRAVVYLSVIEGSPAAEIAALLGWSEARVRVEKHRALKRLRRSVEVLDA
jgi:RNA polymerase sigma-70 factor (ECF subfamily)